MLQSMIRKKSLKKCKCILTALVVAACQQSPEQLLQGKWALSWSKTQWQEQSLHPAQQQDVAQNTLADKLGTYQLTLYDSKFFDFKTTKELTQGLYVFDPSKQLLIFVYEHQIDTFYLERVSQRHLILRHQDLRLFFERDNP